MLLLGKVSRCLLETWAETVGPRCHVFPKHIQERTFEFEKPFAMRQHARAFLGCACFRDIELATAAPSARRANARPTSSM
eukprot:13031479-Alexandrium_andersonii.AAC.1